MTKPIARVVRKVTSRILGKVTNAAMRVVRQIFANSVGGSDANSGLTSALAKQTISGVLAIAAALDKIVLARGSTWREQMTLTVNNLTIAAGSSGEMPIIDGTDLANTGWVASGTANVWTRSWTRTGPIQGSDDLGLWVNGVRPRFGTSVADVGTNQGWWVDLPRALTANVYLYSLTDPTLNGNTHEITKRNHGIDWFASGLTATVTGPLEIKRTVAHYNALSGGPGSVSNLFLRDGNIHHMVTQGNASTDCIATEYLVGANGVPFTAFRADGNGFAHTFTRCLALFPGGATRVGSWYGFYAHASLGNTKIAAVTWNGCVVRGMDGFSCASLLATVDGCYIEDCYAYGFDGTADSSTFSRCMVNDTLASANAGGNVAWRKSGTTNTVAYSDCASYTRLGGAITCDAGVATYTTCAFVSNGNGLGCPTTTNTPAVNYCVFDSVGRCYNNLGVGYVGNHNVFYFRTIAGEPFFHYNGVLYTSLATFQAATGQDANSVYLLDLDQTTGNANAFWLGVANSTGGPINGDFRINPSAKVYAAGGAARTGTFTDGVSVTLAGPQTRRNFNTYASVAGAPTAWPLLPTTIAQMRSTVDSFASWTF